MIRRALPSVFDCPAACCVFSAILVLLTWSAPGLASSPVLPPTADWRICSTRRVCFFSRSANKLQNDPYPSDGRHVLQYDIEHGASGELSTAHREVVFVQISSISQTSEHFIGSDFIEKQHIFYCQINT